MNKSVSVIKRYTSSMTRENFEDTLLDKIVVRQIVDSLPDRLRAVLALRLEGYTQNECAVILGVTRAAVNAMQKRAHQEVRKGIINYA